MGTWTSVEVEIVLITHYSSGLHTQPFLILDLVVAKIVKLSTMNKMHHGQDAPWTLINNKLGSTLISQVLILPTNSVPVLI